MRFPRLSLISALMAGTLLLAGCGGTSGFMAASQVRAPGVAKVKSTIAAKPTLEQAFEAARAAARQSGGATQLATAGGYDVGRDGRLLTAEELRARQMVFDPMEQGGAWTFSFVHPQQLRNKKDGQRLVGVTVTSNGQVFVGESTMSRAVYPWSFRPESSVPLAKAIQLAIADGLAGEAFHVNLAPADSQFFGAQSDAPLGPPSYLIGTGPGYEFYRHVSSRSGLLHQEPTAADLDQVRRMMGPIVSRWHGSLTQGDDRPVNRQDLLKAGMDPDGVDSYIAMFDRDGDRQIARSEFLAQFTAPRWLKGWRETAIKSEYYGADQNQDERLTPDEAARTAFTYMGFKGDRASFPLPVSTTEFAQADTNGDGSLDLNEFMPLGTLKTLRLLELEPKAANSFFFIQTKPWSH